MNTKIYIIIELILMLATCVIKWNSLNTYVTESLKGVFSLTAISFPYVQDAQVFIPDWSFI